MEPNERRHALLMAAKSVFAEMGYHAAGVADVIARAGVARGTFYLYFKSKRDVFSALMDHTIQALAETLEPIAQTPERIVPSFLTNIERIKSYFFNDPELATIFIKEATALDRASSERLREVRDQVARRLVKLVRHWQTAGILRPIDPDILVACFIGSIKELLEQYLISGDLSADSAAITKSIFDLYLWGIIAPEHNQLVVDYLDELRQNGAAANHV